MGRLRPPDSVLLIVAAFSRYDDAREWARGKLEGAFGSLEPLTLVYDFTQTGYYEASMGAGLRKQFFVFRDLVAADCLADVKQRTNAIERELAEAKSFPEARPLNLDPGILSLGKFQLATTKDQSHRIYLRDGIFAEVTLRYHDEEFEPWPWTYADYRQPIVLAFLKEARLLYKQLRSQAKQP